MAAVGAQGRHPTPIANRRLAIDSRSGGPPSGQRLTVRYFDVEQRAILLAAEDVGVCGAAAWRPAVDRELDGHWRVEFDLGGDLPRVDAEDVADRRAWQGAALAHPLVTCAAGENHVECDLVDASILAADRLGDLGQSAARRHTPASTIR